MEDLRRVIPTEPETPSTGGLRTLEETRAVERFRWARLTRLVRAFQARGGRSPREAVDRRAPAKLLGLLLFGATLIPILFLKALTLENFWHAPILVAYSVGITLYILSRFAFSAFYRSPRDAGHRPSLTVVVAAKNEEKAIAETLERVLRSDYPPDLLQLVAVDDGSTDDTWSRMEEVRRRHPRLETVRFPRNLGKRQAMAAGALAARGEILVFVDSDSFLAPDALQRLAQGFADPRVGAIAAHGFVANSQENWLTGMQAVQYYLAFRVLKAAESVFGSVTCCSGCCSAYRRSAVMEVLPEWRSQTFLGRPATFGDDRSLTNYMLRHHRVIYDSSAHVHTLVPSSLRQFLRQQLRWKKSWLRETLMAARFMWKGNPLMVLSFYAGLAFPIIAPLVVARALLYLPLFAGHLNLIYLGGLFLMSLLYSAYYLARRGERLWLHGLLLCVFWTVLLTWQLPWAIATSWNNRWGTR
jgi:hyaluronan synthase